MSTYIVCQKKRNNPRMDVRICQKKCRLRGECKEYLSLQNLAAQETAIAVTADSRPFQLELAFHPAGR